MNKYVVFFCEENQMYGAVRSDAAIYTKREDAENKADFLSMQSAAASYLGSSTSEDKSIASRENGKKGGRPKSKPKYLYCCWCGKDLNEANPYSKYCSSKCSYEAVGKR